MNSVTEQKTDDVCPFCDHAPCTCVADEAAYRAAHPVRTLEQIEADWNAYWNSLTPEQQQAMEEESRRAECEAEGPFADEPSERKIAMRCEAATTVPEPECRKLPYFDLPSYPVSQSDDQVQQAVEALYQHSQECGRQETRAEIQEALWNALCAHLSHLLEALAEEALNGDLANRYHSNLSDIWAANHPEIIKGWQAGRGR